MRSIFKFLALFLIIPTTGITLVGLFVDLDTPPPANSLGQQHIIDNVSLRIDQKGNGQDVLLIHGLPGSIEDWEAITDELTKHYRVTAYDRPGHGYSEYRQELANVDDNAKLALKIINDLNLQNTIVVGHSYGGAIAAAMASKTPDKVVGFVSVAGIIKEDHIDSLYKVLTIPGFGAGVATLANQIIGKQMMIEGVPKAFHPNTDIMPNDYIDTREPMWLQTKNSLATSWEQIQMPGDLNAINLKSIRHPFIILQGDNDLSVPLENGEVMHRNIQGSNLQVLKNTGHFIQYARPEAVLAAIHQIAAKQ